jgi:gliding motility-associated protein GldE
LEALYPIVNFFAGFYPAFISPENGTVVGFILVALLFISFCISGAEVAFFSLTFKDINLLKAKQQPQYKRIVNLLEQPKSLQASLLIASILCNLSIIIIGNHFLDQVLLISNPSLMFEAKAAIFIFLILLVCEVLPKTMAAQNNMRFAKDVSLLVDGINLLFGKAGSMLVRFSENIERKLGQKTPSSSLEEMVHAIENTTDEEATPDEKNILKGIIKFGNITVKQVMRTRLDVLGIPFQMNFGDLKRRLVELSYSRLPVFERSLDTIKGMIHTKDLLEYLDKPDDFDWHGVMRKPFFVHEQKLIEDLMTEFQQKRIHFAIVADEFGGTSGIVTMEDILEEVIGDIQDEFDEDEIGNKKLDEMNYLFEGKTMLNDVCKMMHLSPSTFDQVKGESDSLAGLILEIAGEIPDRHAVITYADFDFTIEEVMKNRIERVKVTIKSGSVE